MFRIEPNINKSTLSLYGPQLIDVIALKLSVTIFRNCCVMLLFFGKVNISSL